MTSVFVIRSLGLWIRISGSAIGRTLGLVLDCVLHEAWSMKGKYTPRGGWGGVAGGGENNKFVPKNTNNKIRATEHNIDRLIHCLT